MAQEPVLARYLVIEVAASTPDTWIELGFLNSVSYNPADREEFTDITVYKDKGRPRQRKTQQSESLTCEGLKGRDGQTFVSDPGQLRVETLAKALGNAGVGKVRWRDADDVDTWELWPEATFSLGEQSGGNNDPRSWGCTIFLDGEATTAAVTP